MAGSGSIDDRIVSMTFDNAVFEQKLTQTIASLDKLRASLDFANSTKGMQDLGNATKNFDMTHMAASVEGVSAKFIGLATIGITALANLTTRAIEAGATFAKSLTLGPITEGFGEFELKMGSIQTIMAGSGASLEEVNQKLQDLNAYSDRTIYSFRDMTSNIGKFTNAGVGLTESVGAIQGVANVAALAGANSEEASRAMYNFAQALSTGSVKLIDWKSIELANMGTVEFKQQIIDTAVAMGTLNKASDGTLTTLKGTEVTTKNFASTLNEAWFTSDVLTTTLGKFSDTSTEIGQRASKAATQIKTFSQMLSTMKESVGSGWATTFENIFGNFDQGTALWTSINDSFSKVVGSSADARNLMLKTWNDFGSRTVFFESLGDILGYLGDIIKPIKEAFRDIFPKKTGEDLIRLTQQFALWTDKLKIGGDTAKAIKTAFGALFAILDIGWEIVKGLAKVFFALADAVITIVSPLLRLAAGSGSVVTGFHEMLVEGGGIQAFFKGITSFIETAADAIGDFIGVIASFIGKLIPDLSGATEGFSKFWTALSSGFTQDEGGTWFENLALGIRNAVDAIKDFFDSISFGGSKKDELKETTEELDKTAGLATRLWETLKNVFRQIGDVFDGIIGGIGDAFKGLGNAIASALGTGNFDMVFDVLKTGLLGGILVYIRKFFRQGLKLDLGQGALFDKIGTMLDTVTAGLKSLQANVRADTLLKIASAMGILALAIIALSMVDAAALAKSMAAISAGFVQLTSVMLVLERSSMGGGSIKIMAMATAMIALSIAMALLVIPIKMLSTMSWQELAKGLIGVSVGMLVMSKAASAIGTTAGPGMVRAGAAMILISGALIVLAYAIKKFSEMNLTEMAFGMIQAGIGIGILIMAMRAMPDDIAKKGLGLLILALSLKSLANVVQLFAGISFGVLAKGFLSISVGLAAIGIAMQTMPDDMIQKSAALVAISAAMYIMGKVVEQIGSLPFGTLIKGVGGLAAMLAILAVAVLAMDQAEGGVAGLIAAAAGLLIIGHAIEQVGSIPFGELLKGIAGLAAALAVLTIASAAAPALMTLGTALLLIGGGLALVGIGIAAAGKGFELLAKFGGAGIEHLVNALQAFIREMPQFISAFVEGLIEAFVQIGNQAPKLVDTVKKLLLALLDAVSEIVPKIAKTLGEIISSFLKLVRQKVPEFVKTGFTMLMGFLEGLRKNIRHVVIVAAEIVSGFLDGLADEAPNMVSSIFNLFREIIKGVAYELGKSTTLFVDVGIALIDGLVDGVTQTLGKLLNFFIELPGKILGIVTDALGITSPSTKFLEIGVNIITGLLNGLIETVPKVLSWFIQLPLDILKAIGSLVTTLVPKGIELIVGFLKGIVDKAVDVLTWFAGLAGLILGKIGDATKWLVEKGKDILVGLLNGIKNKMEDVMYWFAGLPGTILGWLSGAIDWLFQVGKDIIQGLWNGVKQKWDALKGWFEDKAALIPRIFEDGTQSWSPSRLMHTIGEDVMLGLGNGLKAEWVPVSRWLDKTAGSITEKTKSAMNQTISALADNLDTMNEFNPTITPVLDLTKVNAEAKNLDRYLNISAIQPTVSMSRANVIASTASLTDTETDEGISEPKDVSFIQNIYAPEALSTNDIYRNTKSQIALAKEELKI